MPVSLIAFTCVMLHICTILYCLVLAGENSLPCHVCALLFLFHAMPCLAISVLPMLHASFSSHLHYMFLCYFLLNLLTHHASSACLSALGSYSKGHITLTCQSRSTKL
ncbi:hypothetical protein CRENBAI_012717 [Crenichthys baileyi]|uniref:Uncharacterized protein n=1 Tax=Crenichthys baileyi TaxID=28760 RepID=A0AAV9RY39_9TELE